MSLTKAMAGRARAHSTSRFLALAIAGSLAISFSPVAAEELSPLEHVAPQKRNKLTHPESIVVQSRVVFSSLPYALSSIDSILIPNHNYLFEMAVLQQSGKTGGANKKEIIDQIENDYLQWSIENNNHVYQLMRELDALDKPLDHKIYLADASTTRPKIQVASISNGENNLTAKEKYVCSPSQCLDTLIDIDSPGYRLSQLGIKKSDYNASTTTNFLEIWVNKYHSNIASNVYNSTLLRTVSKIDFGMAGLPLAPQPLPSPSVSALASSVSGLESLSAANTYKQVQDDVIRRFTRAGFPRYGIYRLPNDGVLFLGSLEVLDPRTGEPRPGMLRFSDEVGYSELFQGKSGPISMMTSLVRMLFTPNEKRYRIVVFLLPGAPKDPDASASVPDPTAIIREAERGDHVLTMPPEAARKKVDKNFLAPEIYVYELHKQPGPSAKIVMFAHSSRAASEHLRSAKLLDNN